MHSRQQTRILVLGAAGMLGSTVYRTLSESPNFETFGTVRSLSSGTGLDLHQGTIIPDVHVDSESSILKAFALSRPHIVINCVGIIKQLSTAKDHYESILVNSMLPHRLAKYCSVSSAKLIHFSTDCVFSGERGRYTENDFPDADDLYGRSKFLGEVTHSGAVTLRTSIIGHELSTNRSLIDWFLSQSSEANGYQRAIFSGLPTIEVARILRDYVIPNHQASGLYHLSAEPISKFDLLSLVAKIYRKSINIRPDSQFCIDRSLNSTRFQKEFGYHPKTWSELVCGMHDDYLQAYKSRESHSPVTKFVDQKA